ncbi:DDE-type integrase/transposase/recombinase [Caldicoprobacter algeriensis]|uniref:DDE-type integrase/transposase/recombinase n=1 Tax=Caldicoprobacter algeriensis TaxID=699281 RepID=UPI0020795DE5|nr:DDE-type integrase/transposase/recombinase [Caldicoprobacter algeriensis]MCM8900188.1 DDE-type integrase/transposase/recombinase [Caldicoprobacter algeriensis]
MLDDSIREAIALKKFSLISPVLNGQVENQKAYFKELCQDPIEMPYYGPRKYSYKTLQHWLSEYMRGGIDALKPGYRTDKGKSRKINAELAEKIIQKKADNPRMPITVLYETLVGEGLILPKQVSLSTFYRFLEDLNLKTAEGCSIPREEEKELKRFSHEYINELWQTDVMYGPYIQDGKTKRQTYLFAFIDDASRFCVHSQFYLSQNFEAMRLAFKEAVAKRGIPKMLYTDNGRIYRSQQLEYICAALGCSLIHSQPFMPQGRGQIERFFNTVRMRFLSRLDPKSIKSLEDLNEQYFKWLNEDYQHKHHSAIGMSPFDFFMSQVSRIRQVNDLNQLDEIFLVRVSRKVYHDATLQVGNYLYETDQKFAGMRLEVRYDPEWLKSNSKIPLKLYYEGKKVGQAYRVDFHDNAHLKRRHTENTRKSDTSTYEELSEPVPDLSGSLFTSLSFASMMKEDE